MDPNKLPPPVLPRFRARSFQYPPVRQPACLRAPLLQCRTQGALCCTWPLLCKYILSDCQPASQPASAALRLHVDESCEMGATHWAHCFTCASPLLSSEIEADVTRLRELVLPWTLSSPPQRRSIDCAEFRQSQTGPTNGWLTQQCYHGAPIQFLFWKTLYLLL